jgi:predicted DNA-binding WGR domain protein
MPDANEIPDGKLQILVMERRDSRLNMARFYVLDIEPTLFGDAALVREWGRLGTRGRRRLDLFASFQAAVDSLDAWLAKKRRRGYRLTRTEHSTVMHVGDQAPNR